MDNNEKDEKPLTIHFAPGAFDNFDGTQEELDEMIAEITEYFTTHSKEEILAQSTRVDDLTDEEQEEIARMILGDKEVGRTLQ